MFYKYKCVELRGHSTWEMGQMLIIMFQMLCLVSLVSLLLLHLQPASGAPVAEVVFQQIFSRKFPENNQ